MLEILFLIWFAKKLATTATEKGRSGAWGLLGVGMWIGGELFGIMVGLLLGLELMGAWGIGIVCAIVGAFVSYGIVNSLAPSEGALELDQLSR